MDYKKIIISPFSHKAKVYPYWNELVLLLKKQGYYIIQIGIKEEEKLKNIDEYQFDLPLIKLCEISSTCEFFISIDNFFPHFLNFYLPKFKGFVIFGLSKPKIFGYSHNTNILKSEEYFRLDQFSFWDNEKENKEAWLEPNIILETINKDYGRIIS